MKRRMACLMTTGLFTIGVIAGNALSVNAVEGLIRDTQYGQVQGVDQDGVEVYYGIPYGADPVDELRWSAPVAQSVWQKS